MNDADIIKALEEALRVAEETINRQKAEIERLNGCVKTEEEEVRAIATETIQGYIAFIKSEAIKGFAERLKACAVKYTVYDEGGWDRKETAVRVDEIDNLVKEMTEGET